MTLEAFNDKLKCTKLDARDAKNRPKPFKKRAGNSKYEGNAGSLRVLSRILTTMLSGILDDSAVGVHLIKLHELSEIITAPVLTFEEINFVMEDIIVEYLDLRIEAVEVLVMPRARPKHHYLSHYSRAFRNIGPLISIWAMRMESKHTYFKSVIRTSKNFKNVSLTCSQRHQRAQVSYCYFGLFPRSKFEIPDSSPIAEDLLKVAVDPFMKAFVKDLDPKSLVPKYIKIYGTNYESGKVLVIKKEQHGRLKVGFIKAISYFNNIVQFVVKTFEASQSKYGSYVTTKFLSENEIVDYDLLADYHPLEMLGPSHSFSFILHHYISTYMNKRV